MNSNTSLIQNPNNITTKPLIMVIEDRKQLLDDEIDALEEYGCSVVGFQSSDSAIKSMLSTPSVDLIVTDLDLDGSGTDKSGIALAKLLRDIKMHVVICGYSSKFEDIDLTDEEKELFNCWYPKGKNGYQGTIKRREEIFLLAKNHKHKKFKDAELKLANLRTYNELQKKEYAQLRKLYFSSDNKNSIDKKLSLANYSLRILHPSDLRSLSNPIMIWMKLSKNIVEVEVYGHSSINASGSTEKEAMDKIVELMQLLYEQKQISRHKQKNDQKLKHFLDYVFINDN